MLVMVLAAVPATCQRVADSRTEVVRQVYQYMCSLQVVVGGGSGKDLFDTERAAPVRSRCWPEDAEGGRRVVKDWGFEAVEAEVSWPVGLSCCCFDVKAV